MAQIEALTHRCPECGGPKRRTSYDHVFDHVTTELCCGYTVRAEHGAAPYLVHECRRSVAAQHKARKALIVKFQDQVADAEGLSETTRQHLQQALDDLV